MAHLAGTEEGRGEGRAGRCSSGSEVCAFLGKSLGVLVFADLPRVLVSAECWGYARLCRSSQPNHLQNNATTSIPK